MFPSLNMFAQSRGIPKGVIVLWWGQPADIPAGWALCDGGPGRPDCRDAFIVGAGNSYVVASRGGGLTHQHDFDGDGHYHQISSGSAIAAGENYDEVTDEDYATGTTEDADSRPPYFALCYIIKL